MKDLPPAFIHLRPKHLDTEFLDVAVVAIICREQIESSLERRRGDQRIQPIRRTCVASLRIPTIVTAHTDERDRCSVRASVVFRV